MLKHSTPNSIKNNANVASPNKAKTNKNMMFSPSKRVGKCKLKVSTPNPINNGKVVEPIVRRCMLP